METLSAIRGILTFSLLAIAGECIAVDGDVNRDGVVDFSDALLLGRAIGRCSDQPRYNPLADLNGDGCVDVSDSSPLIRNFGTGDIRAELVQLGSQPYALDSEDFIELTFSVAPGQLELDDVSLLVNNDSFGAGYEDAPGDAARLDWPYNKDRRVARIYLGRNVKLKLGGLADASHTQAGSPSGIRVARSALIDLSDRRVRILSQAYDRYFAIYRERVIKRVHAADSCLNLYSLSYDLEGMLSMYEATRTDGYLEEAMGIADIMLDSAVDLDGDGFLDFSATNRMLNDNKPTHNIALCDWTAGRPIARLARLLGENPIIEGRYPRRHASYRAMVDNHYVRKWSKILNAKSDSMFRPKSVYLAEDDDLIHRVAHFGEILVDSWTATANTEFEPVLDYILQKVCADLEDSALHVGAVEWDIFMRPRVNDTPIDRHYGKPYDTISDTSHANGTVAFLVAAALRADKHCTDRNALRDLTFTFLTVITQGPEDFGAGYRFADFVDGGVLEDGQSPYSIGRFIEDGWLKLGEVDPRVQAVAQAYFDDGNPVHRLQYLGNLARNYALAQWQ